MTKQEEEKVIARANAAQKQRLSGDKGAADIDVFSNSGEVNTIEVEKPTTPSQTTLIDADTQQSQKENAIDRLLQDRIQTNKAEQQKLEENYQAQQKRQKRNAIISSVADGLSALSNMYFVSKGAPTPTATAPSMSEQQAKQNVADRNTYLELLQGWRKRNSELLNNYATYQATAAKNKLTQQRLAFEQDREARLWAKQKSQEAYNNKYIELKQQGLDDAKAKWQAELAQREAYQKELNEIKWQQIALGYYKADISAAPDVIDYEWVNKDGESHIVKKTKQKDLNTNANGRQK